MNTPLLIDKHAGGEILAGRDFECDRETTSGTSHFNIALPADNILSHHPYLKTNTMATVYKSLNKANGPKDEETTSNGPRKNKQRVLILSSRGVTYR